MTVDRVGAWAKTGPIEVLAFAASRPMTPRQMEFAESCLDVLRPKLVHLSVSGGGCTQMAELCTRMGVEVKVWLDYRDVIRLAPNVDLLLACPSSAIESISSATWQVVREASEQDIRVVVVKPTEDLPTDQ